jgi:hypothetical protein
MLIHVVMKRFREAVRDLLDSEEDLYQSLPVKKWETALEVMGDE